MSTEMNNEIPIDIPANDSTSDEPVKLKHTKLGIASFIMALVSGFTGIVAFFIIFNTSIGITDSALMYDTESIMQSSLFATFAIAGFMMLAGGFISFIGLILGVIGCFMKNVKKVFAIIGTIMNAIPMIGTIALMLIGLAAQSAM